MGMHWLVRFIDVERELKGTEIVFEPYWRPVSNRITCQVSLEFFNLDQGHYLGRFKRLSVMMIRKLWRGTRALFII